MEFTASAEDGSDWASGVQSVIVLSKLRLFV